MLKQIAIEIQNFEELIEHNYFYIDKTNFIKEWWENGDSVTNYESTEYHIRELLRKEYEKHSFLMESGYGRYDVMLESLDRKMH